MNLGRISGPILVLGFVVQAPAAGPQVGASRTALVTVVDPRGRAIVDIEPDDFVVRETGRAREVLSVRVADYPIALVLDNNLAAAQDFPAIREAAARFVGRVGHRPIAVATTAPPRLVATLDDDRAAVLDRLGTAQPAGPPEGLFEGIAAAADALAQSGSPFSVIVIVSVSSADSGPVSVVNPILASGAAAHVIVNASAQDAGSVAETLRSLAEQTGGQFTPIYSPVSYAAALDRLADRLAPQLLVEYVVPVGSSSGNDVQLGVRIPGARVVGLGVK